MHRAELGILTATLDASCSGGCLCRVPTPDRRQSRLGLGFVGKPVVEFYMGYPRA